MCEFHAVKPGDVSFHARNHFTLRVGLRMVSLVATP